MKQERLFIGAPVAFIVQCSYEVPRGWCISLTTRRDGEQWADTTRQTYSNLTTEELLDVLCTVAHNSLQ